MKIKLIAVDMDGTFLHSDMSYDRELQVTPLHFMLSDQNESIVIEPCEDGIVIRNNPVNVLTNNPPFLYQLHNLNNYISLSKKEPVNLFARELSLETYSRGMGALGLPGDLSSMSRFVRAAYVRWNLVDGRTEEENISQFFHILSSVEQYKGCVLLENGKYEYTIYSSCCNTELGIYYYKTYNNSRITAVDLRREDLESKKLISYAVKRECRIDWDN